MDEQKIIDAIVRFKEWVKSPEYRKPWKNDPGYTMPAFEKNGEIVDEQTIEPKVERDEEDNLNQL